MRPSRRTRSARRGARTAPAAQLVLATLRRRLGPWVGPMICAAIGLVALAAVAVAAPHLMPAPASATAGRDHPTATGPVAGSDQPPIVQAGVYALAGQPLPVPATVLHPTNMARTRNGDVVTAIYAGSLTTQPQVGALFVLQDDFARGQQTKHLYQTPQPVGALTILAVNGSVLSLTSPSGAGTFDLSTGTFQF
jgi:hypothetical protein